jgi:hypothetical protein
MIDIPTPELIAARIDTHEKVCAERYGNINQQLVSLHDRLNAMSNRMWAAAGAMMLLCVTGMGSLVVVLLTMKGR